VFAYEFKLSKLKISINEQEINHHLIHEFYNSSLSFYDACVLHDGRCALLVGVMSWLVGGAHVKVK
jgi:hypothetical protein